MKKQTAEKQLNTVLKNATFFAVYVLAFLLLWNVAYSLVRNDYVFPSFAEVFSEMKNLFKEKEFYFSFWQSFLRVLQAFFFSFLLAGGFAVLTKAVKGFEKVFAPVVSALRALPTMAIMLILLIWSTPAKAPVIIAFLALFPMLYTGFLSALSVVDEELVEMNKVFQVPKKKQIFKMYLPMSMPYVLREASAGLSFALKLVVSAEILANTFNSLGGMLQLSKIYLETPKVFALTLVVIVVGLILEVTGLLISKAVERRVR